MAASSHVLFVTVLVMAGCMTLVAAAGARVELEAGVGFAGAAPEGWLRIGRADPGAKITLTVAVKQRNLDVLERELLAVSDPDSPRYGRHLQLAQVDALVAPSAASVAAVAGWLTAAGIPVDPALCSANYDFCDVVVTVAQAEALLGAEYSRFRNPNTGADVLRCGSYTVPAHVAPHLDFVGGTVRFPNPLRASVRPGMTRREAAVFHTSAHVTLEEAAPGTPDALFVTPSFLQQLYQTYNATNTQPSNHQSAASFLGQFFSESDLQEFFKLFQNSSLGEVPKVVGPNSGLPGTEAELDSQYLMAMGNRVPTTMWSTPGNAPTNPNNEPFLTWIKAVNALSDPPQVVSVSYGDDEQSVGYAYASRINVEFQKAGVRGVSIFFAAGDSGTGGNCTASKGKFNPNFPTGSPWVTSVGGLVGGTAGATPTGEVVDSISGGGFSNFWDRPAYQAAAADAYLANKTNLPESWRYNHTGRGYPDLAAQSEGFVVVQFGIPLPGVGGTSCATPTTAGVFALLNDKRLAAGKSTLGFLNPLLYKIGAGYNGQYKYATNDVTEGINMGCGGTGFPARPGWDPTSGWGSPNYQKLLPIVMSLQ